MATPRSVRSRATLVVVGSINMDLVMRVPRLPGPGETLTGSQFQTFPGGKGANQAVAAARLGARAIMLGAVGDDLFGRTLRQGLRAEGVETRHLLTLPRTASGVATILVDDEAQNAISLSPGANGCLTPRHLQQLESVIARADALLLQLEIPIATAAAALRLAQKHEVPTVLDCAPVPPGGLPEDFPTVDILTPNQTEATLLSGCPCANCEDALAVAETLVRKYDPGVVVIKMAEQGAVAHAGSPESLHVPAFPVKAVDTTAAGDAFTAALTLALAEGACLGPADRKSVV